MLDQAFKDIMAQSQGPYQDAQVLNNWKPEVGDYTVVLKAPVGGVKAADNTAWLRLSGTLLDESQPEIHGREFTVGFYTSKNVVGLKNDTAVLFGRIIPSILEACEQMENVAGWVVGVNVREYMNKQTKVKSRIVQISQVFDKATTPA